jgi:hypothetical protein
MGPTSQCVSKGRKRGLTPFAVGRPTTCTRDADGRRRPACSLLIWTLVHRAPVDAVRGVQTPHSAGEGVRRLGTLMSAGILPAQLAWAGRWLGSLYAAASQPRSALTAASCRLRLRAGYHTLRRRPCRLRYSGDRERPGAPLNNDALGHALLAVARLDSHFWCPSYSGCPS